MSLVLDSRVLDTPIVDAVVVDAVERPAAAPLGRSEPAATPVAAMSRRVGVVAIVVSAAGMSLSGLFARMTTPAGASTGEALTMGRMLVGALGMMVILTLSGRLSQLRKVKVTRSVVLGGVFLGLSLATYLSATVLTDLSRAVVLHYLGPILSTVLARFVLKERVSTSDALSLGGSFVGMMLAAGLIGTDFGPTTRNDALGMALAATSGIFYGATLLSYRYRSDMPSDVRSFWNFAFGALATLGMVALVRPDLSGMTATNWAWAGGFFVVSGLLALGLLVVAGKHLRAAELSGLSFTEVVMATLVGAIVYSEPFSPLMLVGVVVIVVAAIVPLVTGVAADRDDAGQPGRSSEAHPAEAGIAVVRP